MSSTSQDQEALKTSTAPRKAGTSRKIIILGASILALVIVGLAVGLGVGLTVGKRHNNSSDSSSSSSDDSTTTSNPSTSSNTTSSPTNSTDKSIWQPAVSTPWQIILLKPIDLPSTNKTTTPDVPIWDIDVYTNNASQIPTLHSLSKKVICYFSAGTWESFRSDSHLFPASTIGATLDGYPNEKWLDLRSQAVRDVIKSRIDYSAAAGCDAIDPDNIDAYENNGGGLGLTQQDSIDFIKYISAYARGKGMGTGLKNGGKILKQVVDDVAFSVNEQCTQYGECGLYAPMIAAGKPVFHIEYQENDDICKSTGNGAGSEGFSTVFKHHGDGDELDGYVRYCDGQEVETPLLS